LAQNIFFTTKNQKNRKEKSKEKLKKTNYSFPSFSIFTLVPAGSNYEMIITMAILILLNILFLKELKKEIVMIFQKRLNGIGCDINAYTGR